MNRHDLERWCSGRNLRDWLAGEIMGRLLIGPWYVWVWRGVCKVASYPASWIVAVLNWLVRK